MWRLHGELRRRHPGATVCSGACGPLRYFVWLDGVGRLSSGLTERAAIEAALNVEPARAEPGVGQ
jgi:hypothetical protein